MVRTIQQMRKDAGFQVSDRIYATYQTDDAGPAAAIQQHAGVIQQETLNLAWTWANPLPAPTARPLTSMARSWWWRIRRASAWPETRKAHGRQEEPAPLGKPCAFAQTRQPGRGELELPVCATIAASSVCQHAFVAGFSSATRRCPDVL